MTEQATNVAAAMDPQATGSSSTQTGIDALPLRHFPSRIASLGFAVRLPSDWVDHALPDEQPDFADPSRMVPLAAVTAPHAAIVWAAAARPAYSDGSLSDWATYLLAQHGLQTLAIGEGKLGNLPALLGEAVQPSEIGALRVRFAFAEDGGRLINLTLTAPELLADALARMWFVGVDSFMLGEALGPTVPLWPPAQGQAAVAAAPAHDDDITMRPEAADQPEDFATHARPEGEATLDPEHTINRRLRDGGAGLVPRLVQVEAARQCATLACGAITAQLTVPLGWHVIDDGRRVLVFEAGGDVQVHLDLLPLEGGDAAALLDRIEQQARRDYPAPQFQRLSAGGIDALAMRNIHDGDQPLEQFHLLVAGPDAQRMLRARVTAVPAQATPAANLGELILRSATFGTVGVPQSAGDSGPDWWMAALLLERADRLEEAEECITDALDHIGAFIQVAELYRQRMLRLHAAGDEAGAQRAREAAVRWACRYAASATSGGEGAALSLERDQFIARL